MKNFYVFKTKEKRGYVYISVNEINKSGAFNELFVTRFKSGMIRGVDSIVMNGLAELGEIEEKYKDKNMYFEDQDIDIRINIISLEYLHNNIIHRYKNNTFTTVI